MRGLRDTIKRRAIFNFYRKRGEVICVQETHSIETDEVVWKAEWGGEILFSHGTSTSKGVCVLIPKGWMETITGIERDTSGRLIKFNMKYDEHKITLCNIYAPNSDCPEFFRGLNQILLHGAENKIIIGDFNLVMDVSLDRVGSTQNKVNSLEVINNMCEDFLLCEVWRAKNPQDRYFSWYRCKPKLLASLIDFALISQGMVDQCENCGYSTGLSTDHLCYFLYIELSHNKIGRGYWKLNTEHLKNEAFITLVNDTIEEVRNSYCVSDASKIWEYLKFRVHEVAKEYSRNSASEIELIIAQLSEKVSEMESKLEDVNLDILEQTKLDLDHFMFEKTKACIFRSKARFVEYGEKPTKYYFSLEKSRYNARVYNIQLQEDFYRKLYAKEESVHFDIQNTYNVAVSKEYVTENETPFTKLEIQNAIKQLPNMKTCGSDGLPIEFSGQELVIFFTEW